MPLLKPSRVLASVALRGIRTALAIQRQDCKVDNKTCHHLNDAPDAIQGLVTSSHPGPVKTDGEIDDTRFVDEWVQVLVHLAYNLCGLTQHIGHYLHAGCSDRVV